MKHILLLGDSITFGHGCSDRMYYWDQATNKFIGDNSNFDSPSAFCWGRHIVHELGYSVDNKAVSGNNNTNMVWQCLQAVHKSNTQYNHIIASFSYDDRIEWDNPDHDSFGDLTSVSPLQVPQIVKNKNANWDRAAELYRDELYSPKWGVKLTHMAINAVANVAHEIGAQFHWSFPEFNSSESSELLSGNLRNSQIPSMIKHFGLWEGGSMLSSANSRYGAPDGHPNNLAHWEYFKTVIKPIVMSHDEF
jgi:hypothetical protein